MNKAEYVYLFCTMVIEIAQMNVEERLYIRRKTRLSPSYPLSRRWRGIPTPGHSETCQDHITIPFKPALTIGLVLALYLAVGSLIAGLSLVLQQPPIITFALCTSVATFGAYQIFWIASNYREQQTLVSALSQFNYD